LPGTLEQVAARADLLGVARGLSLISLLVALGVAGFIMNAQLQHSPSGSSARHDIDRAQAVAAGVTFQQAGVALEQFHALNGTYAGADLGGFGVTLARADASTYCVQTGSGQSTMHLSGPGGRPAAGAC
jgi:hypothetical protein